METTLVEDVKLSNQGDDRLIVNPNPFETKPSSLFLKPLSASPPYSILDGDPRSTINPIEKFLEKEKHWAKEFLDSLTLEIKTKYLINEHERFFHRPQDKISYKESLESIYLLAKEFLRMK